MLKHDRRRRIKELREALARGCAGPAKHARKTIARRLKELRRLEAAELDSYHRDHYGSPAEAARGVGYLDQE